MLQARPDTFARAMQHTSRKAERGEKDSAELVFLKKEVMQRLVDDGSFAELREEGSAMTGTSHAAMEQVLCACMFKRCMFKR